MTFRVSEVHTSVVMFAYKQFDDIGVACLDANRQLEIKLREDFSRQPE